MRVEPAGWGGRGTEGNCRCRHQLFCEPTDSAENNREGGAASYQDMHTPQTRPPPHPHPPTHTHPHTHNMHTSICSITRQWRRTALMHTPPVTYGDQLKFRNRGPSVVTDSRTAVARGGRVASNSVGGRTQWMGAQRTGSIWIWGVGLGGEVLRPRVLPGRGVHAAAHR